MRSGWTRHSDEWWAEQGLGSEPDTAIADRLGVDDSTVGRARHRLGIPVYRARPPIDWPADLGLTWDFEIARRLGISTSAVGRERRHRGIPRFAGRTKTCPCGTEFFARREADRFCSTPCQASAMSARKRHGASDEGVVDIHVAIVALRRAVGERT